MSKFRMSAVSPRNKGVIPARTEVVGRQRELLQLSFCNLPALSVYSLIELSFHREPGGGGRASDECKHHIEVAQRLASPVHADVAKQSVFHWVPFRATGRIM